MPMLSRDMAWLGIRSQLFLPSRAKEVHLPFPQEHPYTSHTPQFAMFPDTHPYCRSTMPLQQQDTTISADTNGHSSPQDDKVTLEKSDSIKIKVHAQTQTPPFVRTVGVARPPFPYYVTHKASEYGKRVEQRYLASSPALPLVRENREMLWDYPRSQRHKVRRIIIIIIICSYNHYGEGGLSNTWPPLQGPNVPLKWGASLNWSPS